MTRAPRTVTRLPRTVTRFPRKVVVGTTVFDTPFPGLAQRAQELGGLVDRMAQLHPRLDLVVLPETIATPPGRSATERAIPLQDPVFASYAAIARRHRTYLVVPADLAEPGPVYTNAAVLFDRGGAVTGVYRKVHPVAEVGRDDLEGGVTSGAEAPVFSCDFGQVGIQICWDVRYEDGWRSLAEQKAEIVAFPSASPATVLPAAYAARHRYYVVSATPRDNATVYEPTGMVAARIEQPGVLVHELDLSVAVLGWSEGLRDGAALTERYGDQVGYRYSSREDLGLFWSNDPRISIDEMVAAIGGETIDDQLARNAALQARARPGKAGSRASRSGTGGRS